MRMARLIVFFGLLEEFMGRGLSKYMLTIAVKQAWNKAITFGCIPAAGPPSYPYILNGGLKRFEETYTF